VELLALIDRLETLVTTTPRLPATKKVLLDVDRVLEVVDRLRLAIPRDVQEAQEILARREGVINAALLEARKIKAEAEREGQARLEQSEIVKQAQAKAEEILAEAKGRADMLMADAQRKAQRILAEAQATAEQRVNESTRYAQEVLRRLEESLTGALNAVRRGLDSLEAYAPTGGAR
jgi:cell division septum initiation protein DivIVA